jgi:hypothetical protein
MNHYNFLIAGLIVSIFFLIDHSYAKQEEPIAINFVEAYYDENWQKLRLFISGQVSEIDQEFLYIEPVKLYFYDYKHKEILSSVAEVDSLGNFEFVRNVDERVFVPGFEYSYVVSYKSNTIKTTGIFSIDKDVFPKKEESETLGEIESTQELTEKSKPQIPSWIKNSARWWYEGSIEDEDFVKGIQYLIKSEIIKVKTSGYVNKNIESVIPPWVKNNAGWWASNQISDEEFIRALQYLINKGIILP